MDRERRQRRKAMMRTFRAIRRFDHTGNVLHLHATLDSIGRTMNRSFTSEAAAWRMRPVVEVEAIDLRDEMAYCSDRWCLHRYRRAQAIRRACQ